MHSYPSPDPTLILTFYQLTWLLGQGRGKCAVAQTRTLICKFKCLCLIFVVMLIWVLLMVLELFSFFQTIYFSSIIYNDVRESELMVSRVILISWRGKRRNLTANKLEVSILEGGVYTSTRLKACALCGARKEKCHKIFFILICNEKFLPYFRFSRLILWVQSER